MSPLPLHLFLCSSFHFVVEGAPILSYNDEKLKLTRIASDSSVDSENSSVDMKKDNVGGSQGRYGCESCPPNRVSCLTLDLAVDGGAPIKDVTPNQRTSKRSLISKIKSLVKSPNASTEKPKPSRYMYVPSPPLSIPRTSNLRIVSRCNSPRTGRGLTLFVLCVGVAVVDPPKAPIRALTRRWSVLRQERQRPQYLRETRPSLHFGSSLPNPLICMYLPLLSPLDHH